MTNDRSPKSLSDQILAGEEGRELAAAEDPPILSEEELPGVGDEERSVRDAVAAGGVGTIALLGALDAMDALEASATNLLVPDIQETLDVSDAVIATLTAGSALFTVGGGLVMARLADNGNRSHIVGVATIFWSVVALMIGFVTTAFWYFIARCAIALGRSNTIPVQSAMMADAYPISARARVYAVKDVAGKAGAFVAPLAVGGLVSLIGGDEAWRWGFIVAAIPTLVLGIVVLFHRDPPRGQFEQRSTIGEVIHDHRPGPVSLGATFQRIFQIRTMKTALFGFVALGFGFVANPIFTNLYLEDRFDLGPFERALVGTLPGVAALVVIPLVAGRFDALYRRSPPRALVLMGTLFFPWAVFGAVQLLMPTALLYAVVGGVERLFGASALALVQPVLASVMPYRMRALGSAIGTAMIFGIGGVGGAVIAGLISDATSPQVALLAVGPPTTIIGGLFLLNGARHINQDLSLVVQEIREDKAENERMRADPSNIPVLQLKNIDFSYGQVQVLFDIELEVARGESLALLGTNGAGKSTVFRVATGLGIPSRGVVRLNGRNMTLAGAEARVREGIHMLQGGKGVFAPMSIQENLETSTFVFSDDKARVAERLDYAYGLFPELAKRPGVLAGDLSGGQQQMLALARVMMHEPEVLLIDELSLGLAPVVVQELLEIVGRLRAQGQTMIIVEQSLNVALAAADRAVFLEKGHVRFTGATRDLLERDDLARAVFLGSEQGRMPRRPDGRSEA